MIYWKRFQIYVQKLGTVVATANGGPGVFDAPKQLDTEAPFLLTGRAVRVALTPTVNVANVQNISTRFKNPANRYLARDFLPTTMDIGPNGGNGGNPGIIYPPLLYPAGGVISTDVQNNDPVADLDVTIYYWGMKLFPPGGFDAPFYPPRCALRSYHLQLTVAALAAAETRTNVKLAVGSDADYVFRSGQCGSNRPNVGGSFARFSNLLVQMCDYNKKPYMDDFVDVNYLFGNSAALTTFTGCFNPGLMVPELYVKANQFLWFDFVRQDSAQTRTDTQDVQIVFNGSKVQPQ